MTRSKENRQENGFARASLAARDNFPDQKLHLIAHQTDAF